MLGFMRLNKIKYLVVVSKLQTPLAEQRAINPRALAGKAVQQGRKKDRKEETDSNKNILALDK